MKGKKFPKWRSLHDEGSTHVAIMHRFRLRVEHNGSDWTWYVMTLDRRVIDSDNAQSLDDGMVMSIMSCPLR